VCDATKRGKEGDGANQFGERLKANEGGRGRKVEGKRKDGTAKADEEKETINGPFFARLLPLRFLWASTLAGSDDLGKGRKKGRKEEKAREGGGESSADGHRPSSIPNLSPATLLH
jgi:hypothetical protein